MHPFFHSSPFSPFFSGQLFLCCLLEGGVWRMGPFLPNCIFEGFFSLVHASLKIHLFDKALYFTSQRISQVASTKSWVKFNKTMGKIQQNFCLYFTSKRTSRVDSLLLNHGKIPQIHHPPGPRFHDSTFHWVNIVKI